MTKQTKSRRSQKLDAAIINCIYPVVGMIVRDRTIELQRTAIGQISEQLHEHPRGTIKRLSNASLSRLAFLAQETQISFKAMLTLSYGKSWPQDGKLVKAMLNKLLTFLRRKYGIKYLWFLEFQVRGAPHIHVMLSCEYDKKMHTDIAEKWSKYCHVDIGVSDDERAKIARQHKRRQTFENIRSTDGAARYVTKYALKTEQKIVPSAYQNVGRFWGASREVKETIPDGIEVDIDEQEVLQWLRERHTEMGHWDVLPRIVFIRGERQ